MRHTRETVKGNSKIVARERATASEHQHVATLIYVVIGTTASHFQSRPETLPSVEESCMRSCTVSIGSVHNCPPEPG